MSTATHVSRLKPGSVYCEKVHDRWFLYLDHIALPMVEIIHLDFDATNPHSANCVEIITAHKGVIQVIDDMADHLRGILQAPRYDDINEKDFPTQVFVHRPHGSIY